MKNEFYYESKRELKIRGRGPGPRCLIHCPFAKVKSILFERKALVSVFWTHFNTFFGIFQPFFDPF